MFTSTDLKAIITEARPIDVGGDGGTQSTAASVSEPRSGMSTPGKDASRTVPQASQADNREVVTGPHRESGETNSGTAGGRQLQPALRTGVASGAVDSLSARAVVPGGVHIPHHGVVRA